LINQSIENNFVIIGLLFLGEIASCSASDFAYCDTFLRSVVWRLSVVCLSRAPLHPT